MRKLFMFLLAIFLSGGLLHAQDDDFGDAWGGIPEVGDLLFEIGSTPFGANDLLTFGSFRARYVISNDVFVRLGVGMEFNSNQSTPDVTTNYASYEFRPGVEYYFTKDDQFRSYLAIDGIVGFADASVDSKNPAVPSVTGASYNPTGTNPSVGIGSSSYFRYGGVLSVGADYHFSSRFYIGAEIGFHYFNDQLGEVSVDGVLVQDFRKRIGAGIATQNSLRIGFKLY